MAEHDYQSVLSDLGLSSNESLVYEFLLKSGPTPASAIAQKTSIKRTNTYHILDQLEARHLVQKKSSGPKTLFSAKHPRALVKQVERQEQRLLGVRQHISSVMDSLTETYARAMNQPSVLSFCGLEEYLEVQEACGKQGELTISLIDASSALSLLGAKYEMSVLARAERSAQIELLCTSPFPARVAAVLSERGVRIRELSKDNTIPNGIEYTCSERCCIITSFEKAHVTGVCIEDPTISRATMLLIRALSHSLANPEP